MMMLEFCSTILLLESSQSRLPATAPYAAPLLSVKEQLYQSTEILEGSGWGHAHELLGRLFDVFLDYGLASRMP